MREAGAEVQTQAGACDAELLRFLDDALHQMSQPITVLLCTFEYGASLSSMEELRRTLLTGQQASERLRVTVLSLRERLQDAIKQASTSRGPQ